MTKQTWIQRNQHLVVDLVKDLKTELGGLEGVLLAEGVVHALEVVPELRAHLVGPIAHRPMDGEFHGTVKESLEFAGICWNFQFQQIPVPIPQQAYMHTMQSRGWNLLAFDENSNSSKFQCQVQPNHIRTVQLWGGPAAVATTGDADHLVVLRIIPGAGRQIASVLEGLTGYLTTIVHENWSHG